MSEPDILTVSDASVFLGDLTARSFRETGFDNPAIAGYASGVLNRFVEPEKLRREGYHVDPDTVFEIRNARRIYQGKRATGHHRYIGDYVMFMSGLFSEYVEKRTVSKIYIAEGADSYSYVARHADKLGALFEALSANLGKCVAALNYMREKYIRLESPDEGVVLLEMDEATKTEMLQNALNEWNNDDSQEAMKRALYWARELGFDEIALLKLKQAHRRN